MSCRSIQPKLDLYAGDDLAGRDAAEVEAHLRSCLACYREYVGVRDLIIQVRGSGRAMPAAEKHRSAAAIDSLVVGVMRQVQGPPPPAPRFVARLTLVSGWAAAVLLGASLGWKSLRPVAAPVKHDGGLRPSVRDTQQDDSPLHTIDAEGGAESSFDAKFINDLRLLEGSGPSGTPRARAPRPVPVRSGRKDF